MKFSIPTIIATYYSCTTMVAAFNIPKDPSNMGRRDVIESIKNTAFGIATGSAIMTAPIGNINDDIAFAAIVEQDGNLLTDGVSGRSSVMSATPRQKINVSKNTIQSSWVTYIDTNQWTTLTNSYNTQNPIIRYNANIIVNQNPTSSIIATRRNTMFTQLDSTKLAINQQDQTLARARTLILVDRMIEFLNVAPLP